MSHIALRSLDLRKRTSLVVLSILCLGITAVLRFHAFQSDRTIPSDTMAFVQAERLLTRANQNQVAPFRVEYPVYIYEMAAVNRVVSDPAVAAQIASFANAMATSEVLFILVWTVTRNWAAPVVASLVFAVNPALVEEGMAPLYDSALSLLLVALLLCICVCIKSRSNISFFIGAIVCGLAMAARGQGIGFPLCLAVVALLLLGKTRMRAFMVTAMILIVSVATCELIRLPLRNLVSNLEQDHVYCLKQVILDGLLFSKGQAARDAAVYRLSPDCSSSYFESMKPCDIPWPVLLKTHAASIGMMAIRNTGSIFARKSLLWLSPLPLLLAILWPGAVKLEYRQFALILALFAGWFILNTIVLQLQARYLDPVGVVTCVMAGIVMASVRMNAITPITCLVAAGCIVFALDYNNLGPQPSSRAYRQAALGVSHENVSARYLGVYVYNQNAPEKFTFDPPDRIARYAKINNIRYLISGPLERTMNPAATRCFRTVATYGAGDQRVDVLFLQ